MGVKFYPDIEFIKNTMRPKPESGERVLLAFLERYLSNVQGNFEVYFQGKINGHMPDVVIMRKNHGVIIIEVKDWTLDKYRIIDEKTWLCIHPKGSDKSVEVRSPIAQVHKYNEEFFKTFSRTLAEIELNQKLDKMENPDKKIPDIRYVISKAVFFYGTDETQLRKFFVGHLKERKGVLHSKGVALLTADRLKQGGKKGGIGLYKNIFSPEIFLDDKKSILFNDEIYEELARNLKPSEQSLLKYADIKLNAEQEALSKSFANVKQKVRGPAGCGKTLVMAKRAVNAYLRTNEPVLILTFNITLRHYIRDVISAILGGIPKKGKILRTFFIIDNYHNFIKSYRNKNNYLDEGYKDEGKFKDSYKLSDTSERKYKSIFVDEIQDFQPTKNVTEATIHEWVDTIHRLLEPGGELVFFGDEEQNIYQSRLEKEKEKYRIYTGIEGDWKRLEKTYRLSGNIANLARAFQKRFFPEFDDNIIEPAQQLDATIDYYFLGYSEIDKVVVDKIFEIFLEMKRERKFADDDVCILAQFIRSKFYGPILLKLDKKFRDSGYSTITTFEKLEDYERVREVLTKLGVGGEELEQEMLEGIQRTAKLTFQMGSGKIKLATIHSYKGWGIDNEILILSKEGSYVTKEMIYTAITRAKKHLVIINLDNTKYDDFFSEYLNREKVLAITNSYNNVF